MTPLDAPRSTAFDRICDRLFLLGLLAAILYVLTLPVFPTGDGPVHVYYADVLRSLLQHSNSYARDYAVRHVVAPYLVHYLALIAFERMVAPSMAEKLFVAAIFLVTGFGFRRLARALGPNSGIACLWALPLFFSWSLGGGFLNCCFATGAALFCWALWIRLSAEATTSRKASGLAGYALLLAVLVLSHPVPLLVLLLFSASDLLLQATASVVQGGFRLRALGAQLVAFALTIAAFVAPVLLAQKGQAAAVLPEIGFHRDVLFELITGMRLGFFAGINAHSAAGWLAALARMLLVVIVPAVAWALMQSKRSATKAASSPKWSPIAYLPLTPSGRLTLISTLYLAATVFFPRSLNHSYFFPQRMWNIVWLLVAACLAGVPLSSQAQRLAAGLGLLSIALTSILGLPALTRIARAQQLLAAAPIPETQRGLLLASDTAEQQRGAGTSYPVWFWAGVRAFESRGAILLNSPWLGLTILPVRDAPAPATTQALAHALLDRGLPSLLSENPIALTHALAPFGPGGAARDSERRAILERADFFLYVDPPSSGTANSFEQTQRAAATLVADQLPKWRCQTPQPFYAICVKAR